jgi:hypothetical protein
MDAQQPAAAATPQTPPAGWDRFLLAIVAGTILLVIVSILVVFLYGRSRTAPPVDPNSPAGVVQAYVEATRNGEIEKARGYLTREARAQVEQRDRQNTYSPPTDDNVRIVIETATVTDTTAEVKVSISHFYARSDPFSSSNYHRDTSVRLVREDGAWRISQPLDAYAFS